MRLFLLVLLSYPLVYPDPSKTVLWIFKSIRIRSVAYYPDILENYIHVYFYKFYFMQTKI